MIANLCIFAVAKRTNNFVIFVWQKDFFKIDKYGGQTGAQNFK